MKTKLMKKHSIDELNNMSYESIFEIEEEAYEYYKKVRAVRKFTEECERED